MITATVRYQLPPHIDHAARREHFHKIAPGFQRVQGLISKHFIWSESGWAGGVYQWETREDAQLFYGGAWLDGIVERYGMRPQIEFYEVFALTDNAHGRVAHGVVAQIARVEVVTAVVDRQHPGRVGRIAERLVEVDHRVEGPAVAD